MTELLQLTRAAKAGGGQSGDLSSQMATELNAWTAEREQTHNFTFMLNMQEVSDNVVSTRRSFSLVTFTSPGVINSVGFSLVTSTNTFVDLALPLTKLMFKWHVAIHVLMQKRPGHCSFGEPISSHVTSINPKHAREDLVVKQLPEILDMAEQGLLCWLLDESCSHCSKH